MSKTARFDALTGVRWLAASLVFVYHNRKYWRADVPSGLLHMMNQMNLGVSLFFVLSGFLIAWTYEDKPLQNRNSLWRYWLTRAARILPVYWLVLTARYIDFGVKDPLQPWLTYPLLHGFSDVHNLDAIAQSWTLTVEMTFYLMAPLLFRLWNKGTGKLLLFLLGMHLAATTIGLGWHHFFHNSHKFLYPWSFMAGGTFFGRFPEFIAGMWLARELKQPKLSGILQFRYKTLSGLLLFFLIMPLLDWFAGLTNPLLASPGSQLLLFTLLVPPTCLLFLAGLATETTWLSRFFGYKILMLLGNASFAFYLIHISYVNIRLREWVLWPDRNFVLLWLVSIVIYLAFEKPLYNWLRRKIQPAKTVATN